MNLKKISSILLALLLVVSMIGCASKEGPGSSEKAEEAPAATEAEAPKEAEAAPEEGDKQIKIGMATFMMAQEWYQNIVAGGQVKADELGVELIVADANNDSAKQVEMIENLISQNVDAIIISPVDAKALVGVVKKAQDAGIKVICESNMVEGADTRVGVSDRESGIICGEWYAEYAKANNIDPKILILGYQSLENCQNRSEGFKEGMDNAGLEYEVVIEVDGGFREESMNAATDAFTAHPDINTVFGINDDSTLGAMSAIKQAGLEDKGITTILYGLEGVAGRGALKNDELATAGLSTFAEYVGNTCIKAAMDAIAGEELPEEYISPSVVLDKTNFDEYFTENGDTFDVNFAAVDKLVEQ